MEFNNFVRSNTIIHAGIVMGSAMIFVILYFVVGINDSPAPSPINENALLFLAAIPWFGSRLVYRSGIGKAANEVAISDKLKTFRTAFVMALAIAEGITLMGIIYYFIISPATSLLFVIGVGLVTMLLLRPSRERLIRELELNENDLS